MYQKHGFTLIELLVVVLIIGILSAVALPQYTKAVAKSRMTQAQLVLREMVRAQTVFYLANGRYANNTELELLDFSFPNCTVSSNFVCAGKFSAWATLANDPASGRFTVLVSNKPTLPLLSYWPNSSRYICSTIDSADNVNFQRSLCESLGGKFIGSCAMGEGQYCYELPR